jgi:hypothetical protein
MSDSRGSCLASAHFFAEAFDVFQSKLMLRAFEHRFFIGGNNHSASSPYTQRLTICIGGSTLESTGRVLLRLRENP